MRREYLIELTAEAIYHARRKEIDEVVNQTIHLPWKSSIVCDNRSDLELAEWERDDYRSEAKAALKVLLKNFESIEEIIIKDIIE